MSDDPAPRDAAQRDRGNAPAPGPGWRVTPPPRGRANRGQPGTPSPRRNQRWIIAGLIVGAAGPEPVDLLAGPQAQRACTDPLHPDVPRPDQGRQRHRDLLDERLDPGHVQGRGQIPAGRERRSGDEVLLHPGPVVCRQPPAVDAAREQQRHGRRQQPRHRALVPHQPDLRLRPDAAARAAVRVPDQARCQCRRRRRRPDVVRALARAPRGGRRAAGDVRRRRRDRRGQGRADRDRRLPQEPRQVPEARRPDPARRAAQRRRPGPARRCSPARSPARRASRSSRCRRRSSSR